MRRKVKNKKKDLRKLYILALVIACSMSVGYAILSATLTINGTAEITSTWSIVIKSITISAQHGSAVEVTSPTNDGSLATFDVKLRDPGDYITYQVIVKNEGTLDAQLDAIVTTPSEVTTATTGIKYTVSGGTIGQVLKAGATKTFFVKAEWLSTDTKVPEVLNKQVQVDFNYKQMINPAAQDLAVLRTTGSSTTQYLGHSLTKSNVESITITNSKTVPAGALDSWGVATGSDATKIMAYTLDDDSDSKYELYIGGDGGIQANADSSYLFQNFTNVTSITGFNNLYTDNVINMRLMFSNCGSLTSLDLSNFNTSNVESMGFMFYNCSGLIRLDLSSFNTSNVTSLDYMFQGCAELTSINLSSFNTSFVQKMEHMFYGCSGLTSLDLSSFNTSIVSRMDYMFYNCSSLTSLNLSSFNTSSVQDMSYMFRNCSNLTSLDLSNFNTSSVTNMNQMFYSCSKLTTTINITTTSSTYTYMFNGAATQSGAQITVNYTSGSSSLVDSMIATKSSSSNVVKGSLITS